MKVLKKIFEQKKEKMARGRWNSTWIEDSQHDPFTKYYWDDQIIEDKESRACSTHKRYEKWV
jgi:hypothetical protein